MAVHEFEIVLGDVMLGPAEIDRIYEAGCSDGTLAVSNGVASVYFDREHPGNIGDAILSARDDLRKAGFMPLSASTFVVFNDEPVSGNDASN